VTYAHIHGWPREGFGEGAFSSLFLCLFNMMELFIFFVVKDRAEEKWEGRKKLHLLLEIFINTAWA